MVTHDNVIEFPFDQLELTDLELFLNRQLEKNEVLVNLKGNKGFFEKREGKLYCYQVRLFVADTNFRDTLFEIEENKKNFVETQEAAGWQYMGQLHEWYIFRSLVEKQPIYLEKDLQKEYREIRKNYLLNQVLSIFIRGLIILLCLLNVIWFNPMETFSCNYMAGLFITIIFVGVLILLQLKKWLLYKRKIRNRIHQNEMTIPSNEVLLKKVKKEHRMTLGLCLGSIFSFCVGMCLDGLFTNRWQYFVIAILISGVFIGTLVEEVGKTKRKKGTTQIGKLGYIICLLLIIATSIGHAVFEPANNYLGEAAVKMKGQLREEPVLLLFGPVGSNEISNLDITVNKTKTLWFSQCIEYTEWQSDVYMCMNYYEARSVDLAKMIFKFLCYTQDINEKNGYQAVNPSRYNADEAYLGRYGRSIYLRKGDQIVEVRYTSEKLEGIQWQNRIYNLVKNKKV